MAVKIRLRRTGAKNNPHYRIVVADSRRAATGKFIEEIGYYSPVTEPVTIKIDKDKANKWIGNGAKPSATVDRIFRENGVYDSQED